MSKPWRTKLSKATEYTSRAFSSVDKQAGRLLVFVLAAQEVLDDHDHSDGGASAAQAAVVHLRQLVTNLPQPGGVTDELAAEAAPPAAPAAGTVTPPSTTPPAAPAVETTPPPLSDTAAAPPPAPPSAPLAEAHAAAVAALTEAGLAEAVRALLKRPKPTRYQLIHMVAPRLYVGGWTALNNECEALRKIKATHVLSIVSSDMPRRLPAHFKRLHLVCDDTDGADIGAHFEAAVAFIDEGRSADGGVVYVHCGGGISRAPTLVCAYLMRTSGLGRRDAV